MVVVALVNLGAAVAYFHEKLHELLHAGALVSEFNWVGLRVTYTKDLLPPDSWCRTNHVETSAWRKPGFMINDQGMT